MIRSDQCEWAITASFKFILFVPSPCFARDGELESLASFEPIKLKAMTRKLVPHVDQQCESVRGCNSWTGFLLHCYHLTRSTGMWFITLWEAQQSYESQRSTTLFKALGGWVCVESLQSALYLNYYFYFYLCWVSRGGSFDRFHLICRGFTDENKTINLSCGVVVLLGTTGNIICCSRSYRPQNTNF